MHRLGWLNLWTLQPVQLWSIHLRSEHDSSHLYKSKSFCSFWIHQEGKTTPTTSTPGRYWGPSFCMSGMTLEVHRKKLQTSGWQKETTTGVQQSQGVLRSCMRWGRFWWGLICSALQPLSSASHEKGKSQAIKCDNVPWPSLARYLRCLVHPQGSCTRQWAIPSQSLGMCYILHSDPTHAVVKVSLIVNNLFKAPPDFGS